jgi:hypothetical protein
MFVYDKLIDKKKVCPGSTEVSEPAARLKSVSPLLDTLTKPD